MTSPKFRPSELLPVSWDMIEPLFVFGTRSIRSIGKQFGVSHVAILKHARRMGWTRKLKSTPHERSEGFEARALTRTQVTKR